MIVEAFSLFEDEDGLHLILHAAEDSFDFNIHSLSGEIQEALAVRQVGRTGFPLPLDDTDDEGAYELNDPKHPRHHSIRTPW